jgi:DNA replication and repair protein RecF
MKINEIELTNFGQFSNLDIEFEDVTVVQGANAGGKTTVLNAILFLCNILNRNLRRYKNLDTDSIMSVSGSFLFNDESIPSNIKASLGEKGSTRTKKYFFNDIPTKRTEIKPFPAALKFDPHMVSFFSWRPQLKRRFVLTYVSVLDPSFIQSWNLYKKILDNRNSLIRNIKKHKAQRSQLEFWDEKFIDAGRTVIEQIKYWIAQLSDAMGDIDSDFSIDLDICSKEEFERRVKEDIEKDINRGYTGFGPHIFKMDVILNDRSIDLYGSRGESKKAILLFINSFSELFYRLNQEYPILLLDDLESELDEESLSWVEKILNNDQQQKIITLLPDRTLSLLDSIEHTLVKLD